MALFFYMNSVHAIADNEMSAESFNIDSFSRDFYQNIKDTVTQDESYKAFWNVSSYLPDLNSELLAQAIDKNNIGLLDEEINNNYCDKYKTSLYLDVECINMYKELINIDLEFEKLNSDLKADIDKTTLWSNGTLNDSPFDLVVDLNIIDVIFFGSKANIPLARMNEDNQDDSWNINGAGDDDLDIWNEENFPIWIIDSDDDIITPVVKVVSKESFENYINWSSSSSSINDINNRLNTNIPLFKTISKTTLSSIFVADQRVSDNGECKAPYDDLIKGLNDFDKTSNQNKIIDYDDNQWNSINNTINNSSNQWNTNINSGNNLNWNNQDDTNLTDDFNMEEFWEKNKDDFDEILGPDFPAPKFSNEDCNPMEEVCNICFDFNENDTTKEKEFFTIDMEFCLKIEFKVSDHSLFATYWVEDSIEWYIKWTTESYEKLLWVNLMCKKNGNQNWELGFQFWDSFSVPDQIFYFQSKIPDQWIWLSDEEKVSEEALKKAIKECENYLEDTLVENRVSIISQNSQEILRNNADRRIVNQIPFKKCLEKMNGKTVHEGIDIYYSTVGQMLDQMNQVFEKSFSKPDTRFPFSTLKDSLKNP